MSRIYTWLLIALLWPASLGASRSIAHANPSPTWCISAIDPDGNPQTECTVLWLPIIAAPGSNL